MSFGEVFADAWNGAKDAAKATAGAIATGAKKVGQAAKWTAEKVVDAAKWTADKAVQAAKWVAGTAVKAAKTVVKAVGVAKEVVRNLANAAVVAARAFTEEAIGLPCIPCKIAETVRGWTGSNISPEQAAAAMDDARLAQAVYSDELPEDLADRYTQIGDDNSPFPGVKFKDEETGFQAAIYEEHDEDGNVTSATLAFAGTDFKSTEDWKNNFQQGIGNIPDQYDQARQLAVEAKLKYGDKLNITGHSLGGGLATYAGLSTGTPTNAFNAAGLSSGALDAVGADLVEERSHLINNHNIIGEVLSDGNLTQSSSTFGINANQVGETHWIPSATGGGPIERHLMDTVIPGLDAAAGG